MQRLLYRQRGAERGRSPAEHGVGAVTDKLERDSTVGGDQRAEEMVVARQRGGHRQRVLFPKRGTANDISEQEGHSTYGECRRPTG